MIGPVLAVKRPPARPVRVAIVPPEMILLGVKRGCVRLSKTRRPP